MGIHGAPADSTRAGKVSFIVRAMAFCIFFFPSAMVFKPIGAAGTVPMILAVFVCGLWICSVLFGFHNPMEIRHPGRLSLTALFLATCASYAALYAGITGGSTELARASADRWLILLMASAGIVLVVGEVIRSLSDAMILIRALLAGAFFCCLVAVIQFVFRMNPMEWFQYAMPGFTYNGGDTPFQSRGALLRVAGSTFHSIELAVVSAMLLPLSIWRLIYDKRGWVGYKLLGTALLIFAVASTVSRSGVLGLVVGVAVFIPFLPATPRLWALIASPIALAGLFLGVPGLMSTLTETITSSGTDPSISTRTDNYPRVASMVTHHPILGAGPGNYLADTAIHILDNEYLNAAVTLGLVGLFAMIIYLLVPGVASILAARASRTPQLKSFAAAVGAGGLVAGICSLTFDSMSFPVFALTYPVLVGLGGAAWNMVKLEIRINDVTSLEAPRSLAGITIHNYKSPGGRP
ncbi:O-antigen ligase family protein [Arthrobacter sp. NPDC080031]|uniref:O-antigen ligase family protein n=1 Tax=Arthrobacter sp. NPDC080031 TaxID=3155918 RepID=UPI00345082EB